MGEALAAWARCGAMALTGDPDGPPLAPQAGAAVVAGAGAARFGLDAGLLGERAALSGLARRGLVSCGGATRLLAGSDGWVALALPRDDDLAALPALVGVADVDHLEEAVRHRTVGEVADRAALLGIACSVVGGGAGPFTSTKVARDPPPAGLDGASVLDLTALWAGPLCTSLLGRLGARVLKVEDVARPDAAVATPDFFARLDEGKDHATIDLAVDGRAVLRSLVDDADVVVTAGRQRAIRGLGLDPLAQLRAGRSRVWVAITGHGWSDPRIGFGDDAAAAAGLVAWGADGRPRFAGDAVADPLCGIAAAAAVLDAFEAGGRWFVDASLSGAAARTTPGDGPAVAAVRAPDGGWCLPDRTPVAPPAAPTRPGAGARPAGGRGGAAPTASPTAGMGRPGR